ncbi:MAG TPA: ABC transporter ATP-binding protein [Chthoniobacter sp.]|nr:ABC transporter ATP-binding protein [Chthoniobacter sp.]
MSSDLVISVRGVGKTFQVASTQHRATTLAELLAQKLRKPFTRHQREVEFNALDDVSFEVRRGEVLGIIGRNGAGKSTLLKILSQITPPTRGEIDLHGRVGSLLEVGTGFHPELTGRENIYLNGAILGMNRREIDREFDSIVAFAETERFLDLPVKRYSSGMYVRLAFSVAAHLRPDILIVDEVLAVGDLAFQRKCLGKMDEVAHQSGATVLFVSHQLSAVRTLCTRALLLDGGMVVTDGEVEPVLARYLQLNTEALASTADMPPGAPDARARALAVHTTNAAGAPSAIFRLGEPWRIRLEFEMRTAMPHVVAAIGLRSIESIPLITWWSAPRELASGRYSVEFTCDLTFSAGIIDFTIGISSDEQTLYYVEGVGSVTISEVAVGEQPVRVSGAGLLASTSRPSIQLLA